MARLRRRRRILKWAGLVVLLLIASGGEASRHGVFECRLVRQGSFLKAGPPSPRYAPAWECSLQVLAGCVWFHSGPIDAVNVRSGWYVVRRPFSLLWRPRLDWGHNALHCQLPLWIPFLAVIVCTALWWWRDRRRIPAGHCLKCGYDLTGNVSGVCPECGEKVKADNSYSLPARHTCSGTASTG